jgi:glyoxylase-like metal-dependent hydrolase (beta-lactamase superfamily II)
VTAPDRSPEVARLVEVADGVYAYTQPDGGWCLSNAGVVRDGTATVLVDTAATRSRALRLRRAVTSLAPGGPDLLVNTHHHGDHTFGNYVFARPVVGHELARQEMAEAGLGLTQLWPDVDWGEISLRLPDLTFRDQMTIHVGQIRLELLYVGPAHTTNDVVVWIPDREVLFAGDVAMSGARTRGLSNPSGPRPAAMSMPPSGPGGDWVQWYPSAVRIAVTSVASPCPANSSPMRAVIWSRATCSMSAVSSGVSTSLSVPVSAGDSAGVATPPLPYTGTLAPGSVPALSRYSSRATALFFDGAKIDMAEPSVNSRSCLTADRGRSVRCQSTCTTCRLSGSGSSARYV